MKILIAHNYYQQPGGEDSCVAAETALLEGHGHEVIRYCVHNNAIDAMSRWQVASDTVWGRTSYRRLRALIRQQRPHLAHFHNTFPLISPAAYYAARAENVPVVQTLHNFRLLCPNALLFRDGRVCEDCLGRSVPWPGVVHQCYRGSLAASTGVTTMLAAHRALGTWRKAVDVYVALTEHGRQRFIAGGLPARKIVVKPHFVHPDPGPGTGTGGYAVFVGRLSAEKGLETLLAAWKELGGAVPLRIVGDGPLTAMVQQAAARNAGIRWLGRKTPAEVRELLGGAMFLVFPSHCYETFGLALVEAFARGTPVLASNLGAMAELVGHGRTGLCFQPGNSADLAAKARDLLAGPTALQRMRQAAREEYERKYTAERNYRALLSIYEQALGSPRLRGPTAIAGQHSAEEPQRLPGGRT